MKLCPWCSVKIADDADTCPSHRSIEKQAAIPSPYSHAAPGRPWRDSRGITRWVIDEPVVDTEERACVTCDAEPWELCKTSLGKKRAPHKGRIIARRCKCGGELRTRVARLCEECLTKNKRAQSAEQYAKTKGRAA